MNTMGLTPEMWSKLNEVYRRETPATLERMRYACEQRDLSALAFDAHKLRSFSLLLGHAHMGLLAQRLEESSSSNDVSACLVLMEETLREATRILAELGEN
jgi:hypothetical protein